jgi:hypothetical protein
MYDQIGKITLGTADGWQRSWEPTECGLLSSARRPDLIGRVTAARRATSVSDADVDGAHVRTLMRVSSPPHECALIDVPRTTSKDDHGGATTGALDDHARRLLGEAWHALTGESAPPGPIEVTGADGLLASALPVIALATAAVGASMLAAARLAGLRRSGHTSLVELDTAHLACAVGRAARVWMSSIPPKRRRRRLALVAGTCSTLSSRARRPRRARTGPAGHSCRTRR